MSEYALPALFALSVWWFSTGLILYLDGLPERTFRWSMLGATVLAMFALYGLAVSGAVATVAGAFVAFTCGVLVWGWVEMSFLMGFVTGPKKTPCRENCGGWRHFGHAIGAILYHELAIIAAAVAVIAVTWESPNQVGAWTFLILWAMRQSAKLNMFLGVRNLSLELLPEHLRYLENFFTHKPMNLLFPASVTISTVVAALLIGNAFSFHASAFETAGLTLLATLLMLAILEHWFLVLPLPVAAIWNWSLRSRAIRLAGDADTKTEVSARRKTSANRQALTATASSLTGASG